MNFFAFIFAIALALTTASYRDCSTITKAATKYYTVPSYKTTYVHSSYVTKVPHYVTTYTKVAHPYQHVTSSCTYGTGKY